MSAAKSNTIRRLVRPLADRAAMNLEKWGPQDFQTLGLAVCEEAGELAQAILQERHECGKRDRIREEAIDLGALCLQILAHFPSRTNAAIERSERSGDMLRGDVRP
jgi:NTP pyrophosphatase (non-canonical NTP hydrolase)